MLAQLSRAFFIFALSLSVFSGPAFCQEIRVTLLGTGNPPPVMDRFGPRILVEAGDKKFLFDTGRGSIQRLAQITLGGKTLMGSFLPISNRPCGWISGRLGNLLANWRRPLEAWGHHELPIWCRT